MASSLSLFINWIYKRGFNKWFVIITTAFFALFPLFPFYVISLWKDTLFSIWVFLYTLLLFDAFTKENTQDKILSKTSILLYLILSFLISFARNNGIYIFAFTSFFLIFYLYRTVKEKIKVHKFTILIVAEIIIILLIQGPYYSSKDYNVDQKTESLSIPLQQIGYFVSTKNNLNKKELETINNMMPIKKLKKVYTPLIVDRIKWDKDYHKEPLIHVRIQG